MSPTSYRCSIPRRVLPVYCIAAPDCRVPRWRMLSRLDEANYGPGIGLFSQRVTPRVSSALGRFTSVFGMGTGGATPLKTPGPGKSTEHMGFAGYRLTNRCMIG